MLTRIVIGLGRRAKAIFIPKKYVLGRVACLGQAVFSVRTAEFRNSVLINQQKVRCDLFLGWLNGEPRPDAEAIRKHLDRPYVLPWIKEQEELPWLNYNRNIRLLIMDSFAELTDQKFIHKKSGWAFACHYRDLVHSPEFTEQFECLGLLSIPEIKNSFFAFFTWFFKKYRNSTVIFLHFPTKFDPRIHFAERAEAIRVVMLEMTTAFPSIQNIIVPNELVERHPEDSHPYHFSQKTICSFATAWEQAELKNH